MRSVSGLVIATVLGVSLGLASAQLALDAGVGFGRITVGPWTAVPRAGALDADPYTRAEQVRDQSLPLGGGEGIAFHAARDDGGEALEGSCERVLTLSPPPARYWTITVTDPAGRLIDNPIGRHGFTSQEVLRRPNGSVVVSVSAAARPGNWLPAPAGRRYQLVFRMYDTPLTTTASLVRPVVPAIARGACS